MHPLRELTQSSLEQCKDLRSPLRALNLNLVDLSDCRREKGASLRNKFVELDNIIRDQGQTIANLRDGGQERVVVALNVKLVKQVLEIMSEGGNLETSGTLA